MYNNLIRENFVEDIASTLATGLFAKDTIFKSVKSGSITKTSKDLIMTYPIIVSPCMSRDTIEMMVKVSEQRMASLVQIVFSNFTTVGATDVRTQIKRFHNNLESANIKVESELNAKLNWLKNNYRQFTECNTSIVVAENENSLEDIYSGIIKEDFKKAGNSDKVGAMLLYKSKDDDVKKLNSSVPTLIQVTLTGFNLEGEVQTMTAVIGVKARAVMVDSYELIERLSKQANNDWLVNLVRATTHEIKFFRDFVFNIDKIKDNVIAGSRAGGYNKIWGKLDSAKSWNKFVMGFTNVNNNIPVTTIMITMEECNILKSEYNVDLYDVDTTKRIISQLNLMGITIVDETLEIVYMITDTSDGKFEEYSFKTLQKTNHEEDMYKRIINLVSRVN